MLVFRIEISAQLLEQLSIQCITFDVVDSLNNFVHNLIQVTDVDQPEFHEVVGKGKHSPWD